MENNPDNFDYKEELKIDPDALDYEWLMQPQLFMKYANLFASAEMRFDKAKDRLELVRAEIDDKIRKDPLAYTRAKLTESLINSLIVSDQQYKDALDSLYKAKRSFRLLGNAVKSFEQRKTALENLVKLHGQSYFASPYVEHPRTLSESINAAVSKRTGAQEKVKERMEKRKLQESQELQDSQKED